MKALFSRFFEDNWLFKILYGQKAQTLFAQVLLVARIFAVLGLKPTDTIALYGKNSFNWVAIYIASLLRGLTVVIIPPKMGREEIIHILTFSNTQCLFIDNTLLHSSLKWIMPIKVIINITNLEPLYEKASISVTDDIEAVLECFEKSEPLNASYDYYRDSLDLSEYPQTRVLTPTSGTTKGSPKWVIMTWFEIERMLLAAHSALPLKENDNVYISVDFADTHYITVLLVLLNGCNITDNLEEAQTTIEDTSSIENLWDQINLELFDTGFKAFLFSSRVFAWLYNIIALKRLKRALNGKLQNIIIYNSEVAPAILNTLRKGFNLYTTYGLQETCQIIAVNDFSTRELLDDNAVGKLLKGADAWTDHNSQICLSSYQTSGRYFLQNTPLKASQHYGAVINTEDIGAFDTRDGILFVFGRTVTQDKNDYGLPFYINHLERVLRAMPYIKSVCIYTRDNHKILLVEANRDFLDLRNVKYLKFKMILDQYVRGINASLKDLYHIDKHIVVHDQLEKTFNGKIVRYYYN